LLNKSIQHHNTTTTDSNSKIEKLIQIINNYSQQFKVINEEVKNYVNNLRDKKLTIYNDAKELTTNTTELNNIIDNRMEEIGIFSVTPEETGANATANTSQTDANTPEPVYFTYNQLQNIINGIPAPPAPVAPVAQPPPETQQIKLKNAFNSYSGVVYDKAKYDTIQTKVSGLDEPVKILLIQYIKQPQVIAGGRMKKTKKNKTKKRGKKRRKTIKRKRGKRRGGKGN